MMPAPVDRSRGGRWGLLSEVRAQDEARVAHRTCHWVYWRRGAVHFHHDANCRGPAEAEPEDPRHPVSGLSEMMIEHQAIARGLFVCVVCNRS